MTNIDQFESVFKAADKPPLTLEQVQPTRALVVTGVDADEGEKFVGSAQALLSGFHADAPLTWEHLSGDQLDDLESFVANVRRQSPDLICTHRNLKTPAPDYPYSLGVFVDILTQATDIPVLLLPTPDQLAQRGTPLSRQRVMAITDHLAGDHHLVSWAASFTGSDGWLFLTHIEDDAIFQRYVETISKIPDLDTDIARESIREQLLKEPEDYVHSCREVLTSSGFELRVEALVSMGHRLLEYKQLVEKHTIDLLVMNTKDEDQLAMHGLAYPLAVELRNTPLLLL